MSNIQYAFIERRNVPNRSSLQQSINALGFDLKLDLDFTPFSDSGFLPFILNGEEGPGFEIRYETASELIGQDQALKAIAAGRDCCISMAWHGSMKDLACALIVSYALIKDFGAVVSYEGEPPEPLDVLLEAIHETLQDIQIAKTTDSIEAITQNQIVKKKAWWKFW